MDNFYLTLSERIEEAWKGGFDVISADVVAAEIVQAADNRSITLFEADELEEKLESLRNIEPLAVLRKDADDRKATLGTRSEADQPRRKRRRRRFDDYEKPPEESR